MKRFYALCCLSLAALLALPVTSGAQSQDPSPSQMRPAKAADKQAAMHSIKAQLMAFGKDDYKTAVTYQSAGMKKHFPSADAFRTMMLRAYPEFAHYKSVTFGSAQSNPGGTHLAIQATVTGQDGVTVHAIYLMVREGKVYHVEGVAGGAQTPVDSTLGVPGKEV